MNQELRNRRAIDLDELERQLRLSADTSDARGVPDPLAELARLVGNEDPFKDILGQSGMPRQQGRAADEALRALESEFAADLRPAYGDDPYAPSQGRDDGPYDGEEPQSYAPQSYDPRPPVQGRPPVVPPRRGLLRSRGFLVVGSAMVLAFAGIFTVFGMRSDKHASSGEVPVIAAKPGHEKVRPADPGGIDVPNQNKQVFEPEIRHAAADTAKVVTTTEQPIDLAAAPLAATPRTVPAEGTAQLPVPTGPGSEAAAALPPAAAPLAPVASNEPKRVRSIAITVNDAGSETTATAPSAPAAPPPSGITAMLGASDAASAAVAPVPAKPVSMTLAAAAPPPPSVPARMAVAPAVASPEDAAPATVSTPTHASPATPAKTTPKAAKQAPHAPLSLAPPPKSAQAAAPRVAAAQVAAPAQATHTAGGGWAVQLGWRSSATLAQQAAQSFSARYGNVLGGAAPRVVPGESDGKQIYRIRVSAGERSNATGLCERIKTAGGSCFVARN